MNADLRSTAHRLVAAGRGILAADESPDPGGTMDKRLIAAGVEPTQENRDAWRRIVFSTPSLDKTLSAIIVHEGTLENEELRTLLQHAGVQIIVKADGGLRKINDMDEQVMVIPEGIAGKLARWSELGAVGIKSRSLLKRFNRTTPTEECFRENAAVQAIMAAMAQSMGLVPMVEPEFDMDGDHGLAVCDAMTYRMLNVVFTTLLRESEGAIDLSAMVLKTNMVVSGKRSLDRATPKEVAKATLNCLLNAVPAEVPGIAFLSGGQDEMEFNENLNAIVKLASEYGAPWQLTYSSGRSVQDRARMQWRGDESLNMHAQAALQVALERVNLARQGRLYG